MAFWATCKIAQPVQPIWQHIFALPWSALKKPPWEFNFFHIFGNPSSNRHEKRCQMLQTLFWLFQGSKNPRWIVLTCHGFVCIHSGKQEKYICTIFENRKVLFERQLFFLSIFIHYQVWLFRESFLKLILQLKSRWNISMSDFFMDRLHYHLELYEFELYALSLSLEWLDSFMNRFHVLL